MFGCYVKKRGWIKCVEGHYVQTLKCCRNAGDMHDEFIFENKWALNKVLKKYPKAFEDIEYEYKEIPEEQLIDKRVVPSSKKWRGRAVPFKITESTRPSYHNYCEWCTLKIDSKEGMMGSICIHCAKAFHDKIMGYYDAIDEEVKLSWQRAKILDEI